MLLNIDFQLPLQDAILTFALVLFVILLAPMIMSKLRIPGIIGLILAGVALGPHGFNIIENSSIDLFAKAGLLYIMFLAGLELDMNEFRKTRNRSLLFGLFTFSLPFGLGFTVCHYLLGYGVQGSILIASMFSTHTLVAYPIASRLGIVRNEAVTVTVGGTIITDTLVLLILAVITGLAQGQTDASYWLLLSGKLILFSLVVFLLFPRIGRWFFKNVEGERSAHFIFVLAMVFLAGVLAEMAGVEAIIGAFMAGLALNRLIPHHSPLMSRIEFVGNALFIPFFLISVGMLVDLGVLLRGPQAIIVAAVLTLVALVGKWLAALLSKYVFGYSSIQRRVMFGLSSAHAAATIAVILIGFRLGIIDENVLNGTVILILITCLVSSFVVESNGKQLAIQENETSADSLALQDRILVPLSNPNSVDGLMELAMLVHQPDENESLYVLSVVNDGDEAAKAMAQGNKLLDKAASLAAAADRKLEKLTRVDYNIASGIVHTARENGITEIIIGWKPRPNVVDKFFGGIMENLLKRTDQMVIVSKLEQPMNTLRRLVWVVPEYAELEPGFGKWLGTLRQMAFALDTPVLLVSRGQTAKVIQAINDRSKQQFKLSFAEYGGPESLSALKEKIKTDDLLVVVCARRGAISFEQAQEKLPAILSTTFETENFLMIFPQEPNYPAVDGNFQLDGGLPQPVRQQLERINQLGSFVRKVLTGEQNDQK